MPLTGEFRPCASWARSAGRRTRCSTRRSSPSTRSTTASARSPGWRRATRSGCKQGACARLRRPPARGGPAVRRGPRRARAVPGTLALPPRRRVPGHEPRAIPVGPGARARPTGTSAWSATTTSRSIRGAAPTCATSSTSSATGPKATVVKLEQNYRSTQLILDAAHAVVSRNTARKDKKLWTENAGGVRIQRFEAYNEDEEAEWIARQVEGLVGGRGSALARRGRRRRVREPVPRPRHRGDVPDERAVPGDRGVVPALRDALPARRRHAVLPRREVKDALAYLRILRSDTDASAFERIINVPGAGHRREDDRGAARGSPPARVGPTGARSRRPPRASSRARATDPERAGRVRGARPTAADAGRRAGAPRAARRRAGGVGLPGDARRRLRGGRGTLGEPARAARGHDPLRRPRARRTRSTGCSRRRRSSPTRTRTRGMRTR